MSARTRLGLGLAILVFAAGVARARHGGGEGGGHGSLGGFGPMHMGGGPHHRGPGGAQLAAVSGGYAAFGFGFGWPYFVAGPGFYAPYYPYATAMGPFYPPGMMPPPMPMRGPLLPPPPAAAAAQRVAPAKSSPSDPGRAARLMTFGDRLFRAGNLKRAEERYRQALSLAPNRAAPQLRLAVLAVARGRFAEAADRLRDAETAEPGWLLKAPDIQAIYGEPAEFVNQLARLESFVQSHPDDRNAWLVLGGLWFLSGRTARAADVFLRLDDPNRKNDVALAAFLSASNHPRPKGEGGDEPPPMAGRAMPRRDSRPAAAVP